MSTHPIHPTQHVKSTPIEPIMEETPTKTITKKAQSPSQQQALIASLLCGILFGIAFQTSHVHEFFFVRSQMLFQHEIMLKMFLSACATSSIWMGVLPYASETWKSRVHSGAVMMCQTVPQYRGVVAASLGGTMIGIGMAVCGSCPGTVYAQLGAGSVKAISIMIGGFVAALVYPMLELIPGQVLCMSMSMWWTTIVASTGQREWQSYTLPKLVRSVSGTLHMKKQEKIQDPTPELTYSLGFAACLALVILIVEYLVPWQTDVTSLTTTFSISPVLAGIIVGSLQLPLITLVGTYLGTSSAYITVIANIWNTIWKNLEHTPTWTQHIPLFTTLQHNYWQVMLALGVCLGACFSSFVTGASFVSDSMITHTEAIIGGFLLVMGSRMAAGCTSGHGISGMGFLGINSMFTVACMFGGGILTALLFYH